MITAYSFAIAVIFFNVAILLIYALRRNTVFLAKYSVNTLIIITILGLIRLIVPIDVASKFIIRSDVWLPWFENEVLSKELFGLTIGRILILIWNVGIVVTLVRSLKTMITETMYFHGLEDVGSDEYLPIINELCSSKVKIVVSPLIDTPQCIGLIKPCIYLPDSDFSENELRYILLHEMQHIKSHDSYIKLLFTILTAMFWWNPIMRRFSEELDRILELRCDDKVISAMSMEEKIAYMQMMSAMKASLNPNTPYFNSLYAFVNPEDDLEQRFRLIATHHRRSKRHFVTIIISAMLVFVLSYCVIVQPIRHPNMEDTNGLFRVNAENSYLIQIDENMYCVQSDDVNFDNSHPLIIPAEALKVEPNSQLEIRKIEEE